MLAFVTTVFSEAVNFVLYIFVCLTLMKPRFSFGARVLSCGLTILCSCGAVAVLTLLGSGMAALTLLPLIAYLPFSICAFIISEGSVFDRGADGVDRQAVQENYVVAVQSIIFRRGI